MSFFRDKFVTENGLDSLKDPVAEDLIVIQQLIDWTERSFVNGKEKLSFVQKTNATLKSLQDLYNKPKINFVTVSLPQLREFILLLAETLYVTTSCHICKLATESVVKVPAKTLCQIKDLDFRLNSIHELVLELYPLELVTKLSQRRRNGQLSAPQEVVTVAMRSKQIQNILEGCEVMLCLVVNAVEGKCRRECSFYNTMSISIGAVCAGRLAWRLWNGDGVEELLSTSLWSAGTALSAVILQVPRVTLSDILTQLEQQRVSRKRVQEITQNWRVDGVWSYAKLVKEPSPRTAA